jgi:hypothetical protein
MVPPGRAGRIPDGRLRRWRRAAHEHGVDELYVLDDALTGDQIASLALENLPPRARPDPDAQVKLARKRWINDVLALDAEGVPDYPGGVMEARLAPVTRLRDVKMDLRQPMDGKALTVWPTRLIENRAALLASPHAEAGSQHPLSSTRGKRTFSHTEDRT